MNFNVLDLEDDKFSASVSRIFLPEFERRFLYNVDSLGFKWLQNFDLTARNLLWVTRANHALLQRELEMVTGLARVLRSENSNLTFITMTCEEHNLDVQADSIIKMLRANQSQPSDKCETEYLARDGMIWIRRIAEAKYLNQQLEINNGPKLSIQEFGSGPSLAIRTLNSRK